MKRVPRIFVTDGWGPKVGAMHASPYSVLEAVLEFSVQEAGGGMKRSKTTWHLKNSSLINR
jgi:hypothetical protein